MRSYGFDLKRFELFIASEDEFYDNFKKTNFTYDDYYGVFGVERFKYYLYWSEKDRREKGNSKVHLMIQNRRSLENLRPELYTKIKEAMDEYYDIDINDVKEKRQVIVAVDSADLSKINNESLHVVFSPEERREKHEKEEERIRR